MECKNAPLMPCAGPECNYHKNCYPATADAAHSPLDGMVRTQHVLQVDMATEDWHDVQISETLESAQGDVNYWKRKRAKPVRIVRRTDTLIVF